MNRSGRILLHVVIWLFILVFLLYAGSGNSKLNYNLIVIIVYFGLINIAVFYINYLLLFPQLLSKKKYGSFAISIILLAAISGLVKYGLALYYKEIILLKTVRHEGTVGFSEYYSGAVLISIFFIFLSSAIKFAADWFLNDRLRKSLEKEKLVAELAFLRSQINPHFLFNSLNSIYSLAYQKSDKAPEAILKLSGIMRYMLNESNESLVSLSDEINYLKDYISLQKIRNREHAIINFEVTGNEFKEQQIAPLILIAFLENAFKHGDVYDPLCPVKIAMKIEPGQLQFEVVNKKTTLNKDKTSGIGLQNVKRRLDLLYKGKYQLQIDDSATVYNCKLSLVL
ncbi:sensor histidine kinase [Rubrolithibacter danxiaensis]|uniref:sensor histidine kinase n=1 Tax=Rubrolithibacter danxiaensis TaxID=3390805 RepID=UPI003BF8BB0D